MRWRSLRTDGVGVYTHVERFPGWPHGNRTQWSCFRWAQGQKSDVGIPPRLGTTGVLSLLPPMACLYENHSSKRFFHRHLFPYLFVRCYPLFSVCVDFDRQFDYRCHSRWMVGSGDFLLGLFHLFFLTVEGWRLFLPRPSTFSGRTSSCWLEDPWNLSS